MTERIGLRGVISSIIIIGAILFFNPVISSLSYLPSALILLWCPGALVLSIAGYFDADSTATEVVAIPVVVSLSVHLLLTTGSIIAGYSFEYLLPVSYLTGVILVIAAPELPFSKPYVRQERLSYALIFVFVILYTGAHHWGNPRVTLAWHGAFHSTIVYNIIQTGVPPMHPAFTWEPIRYYWPFHALLALFSTAFDTAPPVVNVGLNIFTALGILVVIRDVTDQVAGHSWRANIAAGLTILFGLTIIEPLFQFGLHFTPWDNRVSTFLHKFMGVGAFSLALFLTACLLFLFIQIVRKRDWRRDGVLFVVTAALLFLVHATTAFFAFAGLAVASLGDIARRRSSDNSWRSVALRWGSVWGSGAVLSLPFFLHIQSIGVDNTAISILPPDLSTIESILFAYLLNLANLGAAYLVLSPVILVGLWEVWRRRESLTEASLMALSAIAIGAVGLFVFMPADNQYKAAYVLLLPLAPISAIGSRWVFAHVKRARARQLLALGLVVVVLTTPVAVLWVDILSQPRMSNDRYAFDGSGITYSESAEFDPGVFEWLQTETPPDSAVVFAPQLYERSEYEIASTEMIFAAASQRSLFYGSDAFYPERLFYAEADERRGIRDRLVRCQTDKSVPSQLLQGPLYVVISQDQGEECDLVTEYEQNTSWHRVTGSDQLIVFRYRDGSE